MAEDQQNQTGRPEWEPTDKERGQVQAWSEAGFTQEDIAARLGITARTLRKHCRAELDFASMDLIAGAVRQLGRMALGSAAQFDDKGNQVRAEVQPNLGAICFLLKTKGKKQGWSERLEVTGKNGAPLLPDMDALMARMTTEQVELVERVQTIFASLAAGDDPSAAGETRTPQTTH